MLKFSKLISSESKNIVKDDNNEYLGIIHLLKWPMYYGTRGPKSRKLLLLYNESIPKQGQ
jgi:hypothetical protein